MNMQAEEIKEEETPAPAAEAEETQAVIDKANGNEPSTEAESDNPWGEFEASIDDDDASPELETSEEEIATAVVEEEIPAAEVEVAPAIPPAEEIKEPVAEIAPAPESVTPQQEMPPPTPVAEVTPPQPVLSPEEAKKQHAESRAQAIEGMAKHYTLNEEDAETLITDPGAVMPKIRAEMFMDTFDAVMNGVVKAIPGIIQGMSQQTTARDKAEAGFYEANPLLDQKRDAATVNRYAAAYLQVVPNATPEQMVKEVGIQVMFALGIDPNTGVAPKAAVPKATPPPAAYVPAGAGSANAKSSSPPDLGLWGNIAEELAEDEE